MGTSFQYNLIRYATSLVVIFSTVCSIPVFLFVFPLLFLPFIVYRTLISYAALWFNKDSLGLMTPRNCVVAVDNLFTEPEQTIIVNVAYGGDIKYETWVEVLTKAVCSPEGVKKYPEFQRYYESWGGYLFWKPDSDFDIRNHVVRYNRNYYEGVKGDLSLIHDESPVSYQALKEFCLKYVREPYVKGRSPWEVIIVNNFRHPDFHPQDDTTVLVFRCHHGLCDGYSILKFLTDILNGWELTAGASPTPNYASGATSPTWGLKALAVLAAPYYLVREGVGSFDFNFFRVAPHRLKRRLRVAKLRKTVQSVKDIKNKWGVSFSAVVYAAISGGFRKFLLKTNRRVPEFFHVGMPFPWPGRKEYGLQNNMCVCILKFPVGTEDLGSRIRKSEKYWKETKNSLVPLMNWTLMPVIGLLPGWLLKLVVQNNVTTMVFSNFPGPQKPIQFMQTRLEDSEFLTGLWRGNCGIGIGLITVNGMMNLNLGIDEGILGSQEQVDEIIRFVDEEFAHMTKDGAVNTV